MKRVKTYCNVEFHEYETTHSNTDTSNEFQYTEFNKYKESETVKIDIPELTNQNTSTESSIKPSTEAQDIGSPDASQNVSPEPMNTSITPHHLECNQQPICCQEDEFYYNPIHEIETLQHIAFISAITLPVNDDLKNLHETMAHEDWLLFQNAMNQEISSHWKHTIYEKVPQSSIPAGALLFTGQWVYKIKRNQEGKPVKHKAC